MQIVITFNTIYLLLQVCFHKQSLFTNVYVYSLYNVILKNCERNWRDFLFIRPIQQNAEEEPVEFYLRICFDVLLEALQFGDRRSLSKLERLGRRFNFIIEKWFFDVPFLRLDLDLIPTEGYLFYYFY